MTATKPQIVATRSRNTSLSWPASTQILSLQFALQPKVEASLPPNYAVALHAWFLKQVSRDDPVLGQQMHDNQTEKCFSMSRFQGLGQGQSLVVYPDEIYQWQVSGFSLPLVQWMTQWVTHLPKTLRIYDQVWSIRQVAIALPPTTYSRLLGRRRRVFDGRDTMFPCSIRQACFIATFAVGISLRAKSMSRPPFSIGLSSMF